jgi:hypothetical protein
MEKREQGLGRRGKRERGKRKIEQCIWRGCCLYTITNGKKEISKINGKKEEKLKY